MHRICNKAHKSTDACVLHMELLFESWKKNVPCRKPVTELNIFTKNIVYHAIQKFYDRGEYAMCH